MKGSILDRSLTQLYGVFIYSFSRIFCRSNFVIFPSITICPDYSVAYKKEALKKYGKTASNVRGLNFPHLENVTSLEFYYSVTYDLSEVLKDMFIETNSAHHPGIKYSNFLITNQDPDKHSTEEIDNHVLVLNMSQNWHSQNYKTFGRCYTYNMPDKIRNQRVRQIYLIW